MAGKIELVAPLDGVVTIEPEDTASNFTVTIPAVTSTLVNEDSDIEAQVKTATNATGTAPIYACRAWVNFNGTTTPPTIRASGNVSSVTRTATGRFTVNFTTAMPDADYVVEANAQYAHFSGFDAGRDRTTTAVGVRSATPGITAANVSFFEVAIFR